MSAFRNALLSMCNWAECDPQSKPPETLAPVDVSAAQRGYLKFGGWVRSIGGKSICGILICTLLGSICDSPAL